MRRTTLTIAVLAVGVAGFLMNAGAQFVAFNEHNRGPNTSTNTTAWTIAGSNTTNQNSGLLKNITNGVPTKVTLTVTTNAGASFVIQNSGFPTNASPASNVFGAYITFGNGIYGLLTNQVATYTLTGLDPNNLYSIKGTTIRGAAAASNTNRWTLFELTGADSFTSAHSARCLTGDSNTFSLANNQVVLSTGDNRLGDMFDWESIAPGLDGTVVINVRKFFGAANSIPSIFYTNDWTAIGTAFGLEALRVAETFVVNPPTMAVQPQDLAMALGASNAIVAQVVGSAPLAYQWYKGNAGNTSSNALLNATNTFYSVALAALSDAGAYTLVATNGYGKVTSRTAQITVIAQPPSFVTPPAYQPSNVIAMVDSTTNLSALAAGTPPISYQWYDGSRVPGDVKVAGATNAVFTLVAAESNAGPFYVVASNIVGVTTSSVATLFLSYSNIVVNPALPADTTVNIGATVNLTASVTSGSKPRVQWFLGDVPLLNATNLTLTFSNVSQAQIGYYQAMVYNPVSTNWSHGALLNVARPPFTLAGTNQIWTFNDKGVDLGTTWTASNYNTATWSNGPALLGFKFENGAYLAADAAAPAGFGTFRTRMAKTNAASGGNNLTTYYLRTMFTNDGSWSLPGMTMTMSNLLDDGAIIYLNGTEILRTNLPAGPITYQTWAPLALNADHWIVNPVPLNLLVPGVNVIAVELHQSTATSSDIDWLSLVTCNYAAPSALTITNQPDDIVVPEGQNATFVVGASTSAQYMWADYQWYHVVNSNSVLIPGARDNTLVLTNVQDLVSEGYYYVTVSNPLSFIVSRLAALSVIIDSNPPALWDCDGSWSNITTRAMEINTTNVMLTFTKGVNPATATNPANYVIKSAWGSNLVVTQVVMLSSSNVLLSTAVQRDLTNNYYVVVNNVNDLSPHHNTIAANSGIPVSRMFNILNWSADGAKSGRMATYDAVVTDGTSDGITPSWYAIGTNWIGPAFWLDSYPYWATNWPGYPQIYRNLEGAFGQFYHSFSYPAVNGNLSRLNFQLDQGPAYFSKWFTNNLSQSGMANLQFGFFADDGAIFFLNGVEIARGNVGTGAAGLSANTGAPVNIDGINSVPTEVDFSLTNVSLLKPGANFLSVMLKPSAFYNDLPDNPRGYYVDLSLFADWGMQVRSDGFANGPMVLVQQPVNQMVQENTPLTVSVGALGATTFQWRTNGVNIPGATNGIYYVSRVPGSWNGYTFSVVIGNGVSTLTSTAARITTTGNTNGPGIISAYALTNTSSVTVAFNGSLDRVSAENKNNYAITNSAGASYDLTVLSATLVNDTNVILDVAAYIPGAWFVVVNNVKDATGAAYPVAPNSTVQVGLPVTGLLAIDDPTMRWKYNQAGVDLASSWNDVGYDDSSWSNGLAGLDVLYDPAHGTNVMRTSLNGVTLRTHLLRYPLTAPNHDPTNRLITTYVRGEFVPPVPIWGATMSFMHFIDGGAVFYLNNTEVGRFMMTNGQPSYYTNALPGIGDASLQGPIIRAMPDLDVTNVWATEVHVATNTDLSFDFGVNVAYYKPSRVIPVAGNTTPPVIILPANPASNVIATLNGMACPFSFAPTKVWFEWGQSNQGNALSNLFVVDKDLAGLSYSNYSANLSNLFPGTAYTCRLALSNVASGVVRTTNMSFVTQAPGGASMTQTTLPPSNVRMTSAQLNGAVSASAATLGGAWFEYTSAAVTRTTATNVFNLSANATNAIAVTLSNLNPATAYTYRLIVTNSLGLTNANTVAFSTLLQPTNRVVGITNKVLTGQFTGTANGAYDVYATNGFPMVNKALSTSNWSWVTNAVEAPVGSGHYLWKDGQPTTNKIKMYRFK